VPPAAPVVEPSPAALPDPVSPATASTDTPAASTASPVQVLHLAPDGQDDGDERPMNPSALPASVRAALNARFPGASLSEAESGTEDGSPFFGVNVALNGGSVEVKFA